MRPYRAAGADPFARAPDSGYWPEGSWPRFLQRYAAVVPETADYPRRAQYTPAPAGWTIPSARRPAAGILPDEAVPDRRSSAGCRAWKRASFCRADRHRNAKSSSTPCATRLLPGSAGPNRAAGRTTPSGCPPPPIVADTATRIAAGCRRAAHPFVAFASYGPSLQTRHAVPGTAAIPADR